MIAITDDIHLLKQEIERLRKIAYTCPLTGLLNRRSLDEKLFQEWERAKRNQTPISILFLDLNGFKKINDTLGHEAGDLLLKKVAVALQSIPLRAYDFVARYAGDEFIFVLPDSSIHGARRIAEQVEICLSEIEVAAAIGVASCVPCVGSQYQQLIASADEQMYREKKSRLPGR